MLDDPPTTLIASIAWEPGDGTITNVNVWDSPTAVANFPSKRVRAPSSRSTANPSICRSGMANRSTSMSVASSKEHGRAHDLPAHDGALCDDYGEGD